MDIHFDCTSNVWIKLLFNEKFLFTSFTNLTPYYLNVKWSYKFCCEVSSHLPQFHGWDCLISPTLISLILPTQQIILKNTQNYRKVSQKHDYRLVCPLTPDRFSSIETKLNANLCVSSAIIRFLWMTLLGCHGGVALLASCTRDTSVESCCVSKFQKFRRHVDGLFQLPFSDCYAILQHYC